MSTDKYEDSFASRLGNTVKVCLDRADGSGAALPLSFDGDDPLTIEIQETEKHEPVQGSAATLKIISGSDRAFIHLYTEDATEWRLRVWRDGKLWWTGVLDPEQYEEPYERLDGYTVQLTFTDFGAMDRLRFDLPRGQFASVRGILDAALARCRIECGVEEHTGYKGVTLGGILVRTDNFYDEEGEAMTWREAVESVLQPLALRMVQRAGKVSVYALSELRGLTPEPVDWQGDSSTLGVDKVYSSVALTFNPYGDTAVLEPDFDVDLKNPSQTWIMAPGFEVDEDHDVEDHGVDEVYQGFKLLHSSQVEGTAPVTLGNTGAQFYHIDPVYSGSESKGVATLVSQYLAIGGHLISVKNTSRSGSDDDIMRDCIPVKNWRTFDIDCSGVTTAFAAEPVWLGLAGSGLLKLSLSMLHDCRYNPFEGENRKNEEGNYKRQKKRWNFVYVPLRMWIETEYGAIWQYVNNDVIKSFRPGVNVREVVPESSEPDFKRYGWKSLNSGASPQWGEAWLLWYDWDDRQEKSACDGWATNRPTVGRKFDALPAWWSKRGDGEYTVMPPVGGMLHVEIGTGVIVYPYGALSLPENLAGENCYVFPGAVTVPHWTLFRDLKLEIVDRDGLAIDTEDIVYRCEMNPKAADSLELDTTSGTSDDALPTSRGLLYLTDPDDPGGDMSRLYKLTKQYGEDDVAAHPEAHMLSSIASQYSRRMTVLSGTTSIPASALPVFTEASQDADVRLMLKSEVQHLQQDISDSTFVELAAESFYPVEN